MAAESSPAVPLLVATAAAVIGLFYAMRPARASSLKGYSGSRDVRLHAFFRRQRAAVAPPEKLRAAGFTAAELRRAVAAGRLRKGVSGYWLPEEPDPGALYVMRMQKHARDYDEAT